MNGVFLGESASPFIDEGDGLRSERERIRMLLSLVAHAGGYRMMVGTHNTVGCQIHVGGCCTGYGPWYCGLTCAPCLTFSVRSLVLTEWASLVGWS